MTQVRASRRLITIGVSGVGKSLADGGYVEMLKDVLDGQLPLVEVQLRPRHWHLATYGRGLLGEHSLNWANTNSRGLSWTNGATSWVHGTPVTGVAGVTSDGVPYLDCTGIPIGTTVYPGERIAVGDTFTNVQSKVTASASTFRIYLMDALPSGDVVIAPVETKVFLIREMPRAVQPVGQDYTYTFQAGEALASDYDGGFNIKTNWWKSDT